MSKRRSLFVLCSFLLLVSLLSLPTSAAHFSGGFASGHLTYGLGSGSSSSLSSTAARQWNGVSSRASLTYSSGSNQYGSTANVVTYFDTHNPPTSGALGVMYPYRTWTGTSATPASTSDRWVKAIVYQYRNSSLDTTTKKLGTATHEFGHALSVAHPPSSSTDAVMRQGVKNFYTLRSYDINSLRAKWGN